MEAFSSALNEMSTAIEATRSTLGQIAATGDQRASEQTVQMSLLQDQLRTIEQKVSVKIEQIRAAAGHPLPPIIPSPKIPADLEHANKPIAKLILETASSPVSFQQTLEHVVAKHVEPKPSEKTVREYLNELLKRKLLQTKENGGAKYIATQWEAR